MIEEFQCEQCGNEVSEHEFRELSSDWRYVAYDTYFIVHKHCLSVMDNYYDTVLVKRRVGSLLLVDAYIEEIE